MYFPHVTLSAVQNGVVNRVRKLNRTAVPKSQLCVAPPGNHWLRLILRLELGLNLSNRLELAIRITVYVRTAHKQRCNMGSTVLERSSYIGIPSSDIQPCR